MDIAISIHITAGAIGLLTGFAALSVAKGGPAHRAIGVAFVYATLPMALLGSWMAAWQLSGRPGEGLEATSFVGVLTAYLVVTSFATVRPSTRAALVGQALAGTLIAGAFAFLGASAVASSDGRRDGLPAVFYAVFGAFAVVAAVGDVRVLGRGERRGRGRQARHLWRMCVALLIASFAFFPRMQRAEVLPDVMRTPLAVMVPEIVVIAAMTFWLWRTWRPGRKRDVSVEAATPRVAAAAPISREAMGLGH